MLFSKQKPRYLSEFTEFLEELKTANPHIDQKQQAGRALLWDKAPRSLDEQQRTLDSTITRELH